MANKKVTTKLMVVIS